LEANLETSKSISQRSPKIPFLPESSGLPAVIVAASRLRRRRTLWDPEPHGDGGYHHNGSAKFCYNVGEAFGKAMLELLEK
jgi:hypothetical protein